VKTAKSLILPAVGLLVLIGWPLSGLSTDTHHRVLGMAFFYGALAVAWNLSALTGAVSLGHAAFFGLGAYAAGLAGQHWQLTPFLGILLGGALGGLYACLWAAFFKNLRGARFALASLASVEIPKAIADNWDALTGGSLGLVGIPSLPTLQLGTWRIAWGTDLKAQYFLLLAFMIAMAVVHSRSIRSRWAWAIRCVREDELAAASLGVDVAAVRARAMILSGFFAGLCGGLYAHLMGLIEPGLVFSLHLSAMPLVLSMFGGRYETCGPLLGALALYPMDQLLFHSLLPVGHAGLYGLVIIASFFFFPRGIAAWFQKKATSA
jgi:branched-chain amino acid transport system permease protein